MSLQAGADLARDVAAELKLIWAEYRCRRAHHKPGGETLLDSKVEPTAVVVRWVRKCTRCGVRMPGHTERLPR